MNEIEMLLAALRSVAAVEHEEGTTEYAKRCKMASIARNALADFAERCQTGVGPLSARLRPGVECAQWVIAEVKRLESNVTTAPAGRGHI